MKMSPGRRSAVTLGGLGLICTFAAVVAGAPLIDASKPLSLPTVGGKVRLWPPTPPPNPPPSRIATRLSVTSGKAQMLTATYAYPIVVPAGFSCVWEGANSELEAEALLDDTQGTYETRGPCDGTGPDMALGDGTLAFAAGSPHPYSFYGAQDAKQRLVVLGATGGVATLRDGYNNLLATVDPGDTTIASRLVARYKADGPANTLVTFALFEFEGPSIVHTGTASAQVAGDTDTAYLDGRARVRLEVTHTGPTGTVAVTASGCSPASVTLQPGETREFVGFATGLSWTYSVAGCSVSYEVERL